MKKCVDTEEIKNSLYSRIENGPFAPLTVRTDSGVAVSTIPTQAHELLDQFLSSIKWIFLYVPGVAAIHFVSMGVALLFFYKDWEFEIIKGLPGSIVFSTFMIMLGVGKLTDLKYLRVAGSVLATSALLAVLYSILIAFIPGDYFGFFTKLTLPITLFIGYLTKRDTDKSAAFHREEISN